MNADGPQLPCYLVEWFRLDLTGEHLQHAVTRLHDCVASMCADGSPVRLLMALAVPDDDVVFGIFAAESEQVVARVCCDAGIPAQRLSAAVDTRATRQL